MKTPTTDLLYGTPLHDPKLAEYSWLTRIRVTTNGLTIDRIVDVLRAPAHGLWESDQYGSILHLAEDIIDKRHWRLREFDERVWTLLVGAHSPRDEVKFAAGKTAQQIADDLYGEYPDSVHAIAHGENCEAIDIVASLTRTLHYDGGARWSE